MIYNDSEWLIIKKASPHYESAKRNYIRNVPSWLIEEITSVYESATGKKILHKDFSCAICVLHIIQMIGKTYFSDLEEREKLEEENKDVITKTNAEPNQRDKKKKVGSNGNGKKRGIEDKN